MLKKEESEKSGETKPEKQEEPAQEAPKPEEPKAEEAPKAEEPKAEEPDWKDLYVRLRADFDNYKKRAARDREDVYRYAESDIIKDILPTVDNLALALSGAEDPEGAFVKGVKLVHDTLLNALKAHGAEPFDSLGKPFDPERMEAIATLPSEEIDEGCVSNEAKRGWTLKEKLLRAAQVVVSSGKAKKENG